ncbi:helix-turn-helix domain-containing protein [Pedobacter sp. 22226]|uniref:helix-turn-helix domain-containing protein n=1 Tax=Pedobacter sp. 22226 TaxID=3453894 RepID=UPI003F856C00
MGQLTFEEIPAFLQGLSEKLDRIEELLGARPQEVPEQEIMDVTEASNFLRLKVSTIYTKVCRGELPGFKMGKRVLFNRQELKQYMESRHRKSGYQIQEEAALLVRRKPLERIYQH